MRCIVHCSFCSACGILRYCLCLTAFCLSWRLFHAIHSLHPAIDLVVSDSDCMAKNKHLCMRWTEGDDNFPKQTSSWTAEQELAVNLALNASRCCNRRAWIRYRTNWSGRRADTKLTVYIVIMRCLVSAWRRYNSQRYSRLAWIYLNFNYIGQHLVSLSAIYSIFCSLFI